MWIQDGNDSRDMGDWITSQEWSNGQVLTFGVSADGIASMQTPRYDFFLSFAAYYILTVVILYYQELTQVG